MSNDSSSSLELGVVEAGILMCELDVGVSWLTRRKGLF
jgi:hypothetical protein